MVVVVLLAAIAAAFHFGLNNFADLDSFFYIRQSWLYAADVFQSDFPWLPFSAIALHSSSLWYGFGVLLIPFTLFNNLTLGIKIAGVLLTTLALFVYYLVVRRHNFKLAALWPFFLFFAAPNVLTQFLMVRPQTVSLVLSPLLLSFLVSGGFWGTLLASFGIVWIHLNFAWVPILLLAITAVINWLTIQKIHWAKVGAVVAGVLLGWLLRPNPLGAIKLFYIQVFQQIFEKQGGLPLLFGNENFPLGLGTLFINFSPFLALWGLAIVFFVWFLLKRQSAAKSLPSLLIWASLIASTVFFLITMAVSRRGYNFWVEFGIIFIAAVFTFLPPLLPVYYEKSVRQAAKTIVFAVFAFLLFYSGTKAATAIIQKGYPPDYLKEAALWLKSNSQPGDVVVNLHWPHFSPLFFWNQKNHYTGGLDPIFQYAYSPPLYWKLHYLAIDQVTKKTCGKIECTRAELEDTYTALVQDYNARYVLLDKRENPLVGSFLSTDSRFEKTFETEREAVYLVKR